MTARRIFVAALLAGCAITSIAHADQATQSSIMRRATESLLLDVATAGSRIISVGERGHILLSDDQGQHWRQIAAPARSLLTSVFFIDDKQGWAAGHDGVILGTRDAGENWQKLRSEQLHDETTPPLMDVWFSDAQHGWAVGAYGVFLSTTDGGTTWESAAQQLPNPDELHLNAITGDSGGTIYIVGEQGNIFVSRNNGGTWQSAASGYEGSLFSVITAADGSETYALGMRGTLLRSVDAGASWFALATGTDVNLNGGFVNNERLVLVGLEGTVRVRQAGATDFTPVDSGTRFGFSSVIPLNHSRLLITGQSGAHSVPLDMSLDKNAKR